MRATKAVSKYLDRYAEPETQLLANFPSHQTYDHVLVIPVYQESPDFFDRLARSLMQSHAVLLVVVINQPDTLSTADAQNEILWQTIKQQTIERWQNQNLQLRTLPDIQSTVLIVDRFQETPIPQKQGVGLARKIGGDLALYLINQGLIHQEWIYSSDADAQLPRGYFLESNLSAPDLETIAAAVFPYRHICDTDKVGQATQLYERRLQQYVDGLRAAGSPYAYHTLGSTLAIRATSYAMVRGFPKRNGGEDFYLLNKAAKTGGILSLKGPHILIEARQSERVPFGTGPVINRLLAEGSLDQADIFYHPKVFSYLAQWLVALPNTWSEPLADQMLSSLTLKALQSLGIDKAISSARRISRTQDTYIKHMHAWFDGFRTLRFIHLLRDGGLPNVTLNTLTAKLT